MVCEVADEAACIELGATIAPMSKTKARAYLTIFSFITQYYFPYQLSKLTQFVAHRPLADWRRNVSCVSSPAATN
jgi:hypothetical protein